MVLGNIRDSLGRSPGGGHGNRLQYSCLENPKDCKESNMTGATWHTCNGPWHYASLSPDKSLYTFFFKIITVGGLLLGYRYQTI